MFRRLKSCHNVEDLRLLARQRLPAPIFHYIDGAADDEARGIHPPHRATVA